MPGPILGKYWTGNRAFWLVDFGYWPSDCLSRVIQCLLRLYLLFNHCHRVCILCFSFWKIILCDFFSTKEEMKKNTIYFDNNNNNNNMNIFNQGKPVSKSCYQEVPWKTENRNKIKLKVLKTLQNEVRDDMYNNERILRLFNIKILNQCFKN